MVKTVLGYLTENNPYKGTNKDLGAIMGCSDRQAQRYVTHLNEIGAIEVVTHHNSIGPGTWKNSRIIRVLKKEF